MEFACRSLNFSGTHFNVDYLEDLIKGLSTCENFESLDLSDNDLMKDFTD